MSKEKKFIANKFGLKITMCCASCQHNAGAVGDSELRRRCACGEGIVLLNSWCGRWEMRPALDNAGKGGGRVKKKHYLHYVFNYKKPDDPKSLVPLSVIRNEYIEKFGEIYLNKK